jgi:hypothetical protein
MLMTALSLVIGYDKASKIAHHTADHDLTLKPAALQLGSSTRRHSTVLSTRPRWRDLMSPRQSRWRRFASRRLAPAETDG